MPKIDKYRLYEHAVQSPDSEVAFWDKAYTEIRLGHPLRMREDFCATFLNACEWVKTDENRIAYAVDIDPVPLNYGKNNHLIQLSEDQQQRVHVMQADVFDIKVPPVDLITVSNFSICFLKQRAQLLAYFKQAYHALDSNGLLCVDLLGGTDVEDEDYEERKVSIPGQRRSFTYIWEQDYFNPITRETLFHIHFRIKKGKEIRKAFSYDWRMWTIPELSDAMKEVGFADVAVYWEGDDGEGGGDGEYTRQTKAENCQSWIAYIVGIK